MSMSNVYLYIAQSHTEPLLRRPHRYHNFGVETFFPHRKSVIFVITDDETNALASDGRIIRSNLTVIS